MKLFEINIEVGRMSLSYYAPIISYLRTVVSAAYRELHTRLPCTDLSAQTQQGRNMTKKNAIFSFGCTDCCQFPAACS